MFWKDLWMLDSLIALVLRLVDSIKRYADLKFSAHVVFCSNPVCSCTLMKMNSGLGMYDA